MEKEGGAPDEGFRKGERTQMSVQMQQLGEEQGDKGEGEEVTTGHVGDDVEGADGIVSNGVHGATHVGLAGTDNLHLGGGGSETRDLLPHDTGEIVGEEKEKRNTISKIDRPQGLTRVHRGPHSPSVPSLTPSRLNA